MRRSLGDEQEAMVRRLASGGDRVAVVLGQVGTGKTYALRAAREAWEGTGISVVGAAISRRAARELEVGSGIPSTSVAALLQRVLVDDGLATRLGDLVGASRAAVRFEALRAQG